MYGLAVKKHHNGAYYVTRYGCHFWESGYATQEAAVRALHIAAGLCEGQPLAGLKTASSATRVRALREWDKGHRPPPRVDAVALSLFASTQLDTSQTSLLEREQQEHLYAKSASGGSEPRG